MLAISKGSYEKKGLFGFRACEAEALLYEHGTHFVFPQSMLKTMLPVGSELLIRLMFKAGREAPAACRRTRIDIDEKLTHSILTW